MIRSAMQLLEKKNKILTIQKDMVTIIFPR